MLFFTFVLSLLAFIVNATDSDGTSFITTFLNYDLDSTKKYELSLNFLPTKMDVDHVNISYYSLLTQKIEKHVDYKIYKNQTNEFFFDYDAVIAPIDKETKNIEMIADPRIFIESYFPIKVIASLYDTKTGSGDMYLVPSIHFAGTNYAVRLPSPDIKGYQMLNIFTTKDIKTNVSIDIEFSTGIKTHNIKQLNGFAGSKQIQIIIPKRLESLRFVIKSEYPVLIVAGISKTIRNDNHKHYKDKDYYDYVAFMPQSFEQWNIIKGESNRTCTKRISRTHTSSVAIASSDLSFEEGIHHLAKYFKFNYLDVYTANDLIFKYNNYSDNFYRTNFCLDMKNHNLQVTRIGHFNFMPGSYSTDYFDYINFQGQFMNYVPDASQYIVGATQFNFN
uniref:IgGFc_binding domain-containing protein n=1 Tax=Rhabditophanes sp. KR3021 TaxID=114890 RepID=A0AC35THV6_9BILA